MNSHTLNPERQRDAADFMSRMLELWRNTYQGDADAYIALALQLEQVAPRLADELRREAAGWSEG